ncbi:MAG TPA: MBL fold metallo-hydrolase [Gemmatimonadaceae bacterium]
MKTLPLLAIATLLASSLAAQTPKSKLTVRVLDVGQGDATLIENGGSRVLIDGGPESSRLGQLLDSLHLNDSTFDVVILSHLHADHLVGLRALFESRRHIKVRFFFENQDAYPAANLRMLRDSIGARVRRGELTYRDTDNPCADGRPVCNIALKGGAKLEIMRPLPSSDNPNDRSAPVKLIGPDSASFTMWMAGDAERAAIDWFRTGAHYDRSPGMRVNVLKADHHGSCNGVDDEYLAALKPEVAIASVGGINTYGHMHTQAKAMYLADKVPWYRTDENGTVTITSPGTPHGGYTVAIQHGKQNMSGQSDKRSTQSVCKGKRGRR